MTEDLILQLICKSALQGKVIFYYSTAKQIGDEEKYYKIQRGEWRVDRIRDHCQDLLLAVGAKAFILKFWQWQQLRPPDLQVFPQSISKGICTSVHMYIFW